MKNINKKTWRKTNHLFIASILLLALTSGYSFAQTKDYSTDEHLSPAVKDFLKGLNNGGPGLETLTPEQARLVLVNAQRSVKVDLSGITVSEKTISSDGY